MGSLQSGVLGFGIFKGLQAMGASPFVGFTVAENVGGGPGGGVGCPRLRPAQSWPPQQLPYPALSSTPFA